ncbi:hypothetical protein RB201_31615 [Streptomyces sp. S1A(2023)]
MTRQEVPYQPEHVRFVDQLSVTAVQSAVSTSRHFLRFALAKWHAGLIEDDVLLVASELVTNAITITGVVAEKPPWGELERLDLVHVRLVGLPGQRRHRGVGRIERAPRAQACRRRRRGRARTPARTAACAALGFLSRRGRKGSVGRAGRTAAAAAATGERAPHGPAGGGRARCRLPPPRPRGAGHSVIRAPDTPKAAVPESAGAAAFGRGRGVPRRNGWGRIRPGSRPSTRTSSCSSR